MSGGFESGTRSEGDDLAERVARYRAAWEADHSTDLEAFLPAPPAPHRPFVLLELIKTDMELRAAAKLPVRVETYFARYRMDLPPGNAVVTLVAAEYRLREQLGDKPQLNEYRSRFPAEFDALAATLGGTANKDMPTKRTNVTSGTEEMKAAEDAADAVSEDTVPADFKYQLIRVLGSGAFGQVYEAAAPGGFRVALKRIMRSVDHPTSRGEIQALEAIKATRHPCLIQTQMYWSFRDHLVIIMELADGSLSEMIAAHKAEGRPGVPPEELIPFFEQAAEGLDYLHSQNVTHRDVKPQNLLQLKGHAKVADFGLARGHEQSIVSVGAEVGTPMYMAPEVWKQKVSIHSDQYSLAASYVQARLGRPLFPTNALHELYHKHVHEVPDLDPLPPAEQQVLLKAMAKDPNDRYPSCLAFAKALREVVLEPDRRPPSIWSSVRLVAAVLLVCGLTLGLIDRLVPKPPPKVDVVQVPGWTAEGEPTVIDGWTYPKQFMRTVAGERLVAHLIPPTKPGDPPPFYMLENKVTNRVFKEVWLSSGKALPRLDDMTAKEPGVWQQGPLAATILRLVGFEFVLEVKYLGIEGDQEGVPVLGVTVPEAMFVAEKLGGQLPTPRQWLKATGAMDDGPGDGPGIRDPKDPLWRVFAGGVAAPWPVDKRTADISVFGIHQLASNGLEWTRESEDGKILTRHDELDVEPFAKLRGQHWLLPERPSYPALREQNKLERWTGTDVMAGFRIVLEP